MTSSAGLDASTGDLGVDDGHAGAQLDGRLQSQDLLDGARPQVGLLEQHGELVGMVEQDADPAAEQVHRRLETRREHQARRGPQFHVVRVGCPHRWPR